MLLLLQLAHGLVIALFPCLFLALLYGMLAI
jgi:hypothetical protein